MILLMKRVVQDHDPQIARSDAGFTQRRVLCDGVVLAVAGAAAKGCKRRAPDVLLAILRKIAHGADRQIDGAVDLAEAGTALAGPGLVDNSEEAQGGRRHAVLAIAVAKR